MMKWPIAWDGAKALYFTDALRIYRTLPLALQRGFWRVFALQTITGILESMTIVVISFFISSISAPEALRQNSVMRRLIDMLPDYYAMRVQGDRTFITAMCLMVLGFIAFKNLMSAVTMSGAISFSERLAAFISEETYARYFQRSYFWHISSESAEILNRLNCRQHLTTMATSLLQFFGYCICCLLMFTSLFLFEPYLTLPLAVVFAVVSVCTYAGVKRRIDRAGATLAGIVAREAEAVRMATRGIREIIIYRKQALFHRNIVDAVIEEIPYKSFLSLAGMLPAWFLETAGFATIFGVMVAYSYLGKPIYEIIAAVSMLFLSAWRVLPSISRCVGLTVQIRGVRVMALSCLELLEGFSSAEMPAAAAPDGTFHFTRSLVLENVCFRYPGADADALRGVSLSVEKGESVAIIGPSGSGKTTLALALAGLFEPASGTLRVDGAVLSPSTLAAYRNRVGFVPQSPLLLPGTVADNVALSRWGERYDRARVTEACRLAAMDFAFSDPRGIDMPIGDGGQGVSGGQAQRISIARALFTDPEILILDEATSALDQASEGMISQTVRNLGGRLTTFIIAHRVSTVEHCGRMIWMDGGTIVKMGAPADILPEYLAYMAERGRGVENR